VKIFPVVSEEKILIEIALPVDVVVLQLLINGKSGVKSNFKNCNSHGVAVNNYNTTLRGVTYITVAELSDMQSQKLHRDDGENSLQTVDLTWNFDRLVRKIFNLIIVSVANNDRMALKNTRCVSKNADFSYSNNSVKKNYYYFHLLTVFQLSQGHSVLLGFSCFTCSATVPLRTAGMCLCSFCSLITSVKAHR